MSWLVPVFPALGIGRLRKDDHEFEARLGYIERPCVQIKLKIKLLYDPSVYHL
jgi:hypothetical protein